MSAIITGILSSTVGLLWNKARDSTATKLQDGDVTDAKIRDLVVREMNDIKTKLDALSRQDLNTSYTNLQEGLNFLNAALDESNIGQKATTSETKDELDDGVETSTMSSTIQSDVLNEVLKLSHAAAKIKFDSDGKFELAMKRFEEARKKATEALSVDTLSIKDKIFAAKLRIVSEILECLDNPENAIIGCLPVLQKLHSLPAIQEMFNVYLNRGVWSWTSKAERAENVKSVMLINHVLFQYVLKFSRKNPSLCWPTIDLPDRSFYPISEWTEISQRKSMGNVLDQHPGRVAQAGHEVVPYTAAVNSHNEVIATVSHNSIKIIFKTGESKTVQLPDPKEFENVTEHSIVGLAVDKNDKVYVLRWLNTQTNHGKHGSHALYVLDEDHNIVHTCLLFPQIKSTWIKMVINKTNDIITSQRTDDFVCIFDDVGQLKRKFETQIMPFYGAPILDISEKNEIIASFHRSQIVQIYTVEGNLKLTKNLPEHHTAVSVAFHHVMCKIIVLTWNNNESSYFLLKYSESGELETTAFFCRDDSIAHVPLITSHPSGPIVVVMYKSITYI